jgi:salicylate biosynthesis isochorismate synthase
MLIAPSLIASVAGQLGGDADSYRFAVAATEVDPLEFVTAAAPVFASARYLATTDGLRIGSVGAAWRSQASGSERFQRMESAWHGKPAMPQEARLLLGFSFSPDGPRTEEWDGFAAAETVLPLVSVIADQTGTRMVIAVPPGAEPGGIIATLRELASPSEPRLPGLGDHSVHADPPGPEWCSAVEEAVHAITSGLLRKVVLARSVVVETEMSIDPFEVVRHLQERNPHCHIYSWQIGDTAFVGASPELLIGTRDRSVRASPLAGSARRGTGDEEDRAVGDALLSSTKDRLEHALVVDDIAARLRPLTNELWVPDAPVVRRVATVQHLMTEIEGTMANGTSLFGLASTLHPTPAVGGTPRREATAFIEKVEGMDRGWYSGGVGWLSPDGDGDVAIALRCGLINGSVARLYAGNGIVADSEPEAELLETRWKFRPLFNLLTAT